MAVRIRLSRIGKKSVPFYRIVAVDGRKKRDGAFLEDLGTYDGLKNTLVQYKADRIADWVSKGAIPTDTVKRIQKIHKAQSGATSAPKAAPKKSAKKTEEAVATQE
jgi:small subunit ribosomal protein S16